MTVLEAPLQGILAIALACAFLCGLRPFAVVFCVGAAHAAGMLPLPAGLAVLDWTVVVWACAVLAVAERMADALALHGHDEDLLLAGLRIPLGAVMMAAWLVDVLGAWGWLGLPFGAALAAGGQALKAALRAMGGLLGWHRTLTALVLAIDLGVPLALAAAWLWPWASMAALGALLFVALPAAVWWVRELRSRWRRWAAMRTGPLA
jgi:hypothetical protein